MRKFADFIPVFILVCAGFAQQRPAPAQQKPINAAPPGAGRLSTVAMIDHDTARLLWAASETATGVRFSIGQ